MFSDGADEGTHFSVYEDLTVSLDVEGFNQAVPPLVNEAFTKVKWGARKENIETKVSQGGRS